MNNWFISELFQGELPLVAILFAAGILVAVLLGFFYEAKRRKAIQAWARSKQLTFSEAKDHRFWRVTITMPTTS